jgi:hypothetical protein
MRAIRLSGIRWLRGLKNIFWLTPRQLNRLADALKMSQVKKHGIIFDKQRSPEAAYVLLSGVACITCRNRKGRSRVGHYGRAGHDSWRSSGGYRHQI